MYYSDNPIETSSEDFLDRKSFVKIFAKALLNSCNQDTFTIGLYGRWGSGKTSIINMTLNEIESIQDKLIERPIIIRFEPWHFSDSTQLLKQFLIRLANEFQSKKDKRTDKIGQALTRYSTAFEFAEYIPIPVANTLIAKIGKTSANHIGKRMQKNIDALDILKQKEHVVKLLSQADKKIIVIIDDIDRLSAEQLRQVFQLVSSVAKFPNTIYLLAFDKDLVVKALEKVQEGNGEDYLEKIIQMPIQIPDAQISKIHGILFKQLDTIIANYPDISFHDDHWKNLFAYCVAPFITNLRDVNRLSNALHFKLTEIAAEVDFTDMVSITAIEIGMPKLYDWIKMHKDFLVGNFSAVEYNYKRDSQSECCKYFENELTPLIDRHIHLNYKSKTPIDAVLTCISLLFPLFGQKTGKGWIVYDDSEFRKRNYICSSEKFDRYFNLDVDAISIKKSMVQRVLFDLNIEQIEKSILNFNEKENGIEFLQEIYSAISDVSSNRAKIILSATIKVIPKLNIYNNSLFGLSSYSYAEFIAYDLINQIDVAERFDFFKRIILDATKEILEPIASIINMVELSYGRLGAKGEERRDIKKIFELTELESLEQTFTERCKILLNEVSLFELSHWRMTYFLLKNFDNVFTMEYVSKKMKEDKNVVLFLSELVSRWVGSGVSYQIQDPPYEHISKERILEAIENLHNSKELFELDSEVQRRAAAFYLDANGQIPYRDAVSQKSADKLIEEWRTIANTSKIASE